MIILQVYYFITFTLFLYYYLKLVYDYITILYYFSTLFNIFLLLYICCFYFILISYFSFLICCFSSFSNYILVFIYLFIYLIFPYITLSQFCIIIFYLFYIIKLNYQIDIFLLHYIIIFCFQLFVCLFIIYVYFCFYVFIFQVFRLFCSSIQESVEWQPVLKFIILFITDTDMNTDTESCEQQWMRGVRERWWWEWGCDDDRYIVTLLLSPQCEMSTECDLLLRLHFAWHSGHPFHTLSRGVSEVKKERIPLLLAPLLLLLVCHSPSLPSQSVSLFSLPHFLCQL